jgi:uncharacterized protein YndB with AHSA1/START domain
MSNTDFIIERKKLEVTVTRVFDAPRELLYKVFTDPKHKAIWWRCNTVTNTSIQMDVRLGGAWRIIQKGEDGKEFAFHGKYLEVIPPEKIVNTSEFEDMPGHIITETTTFIEQEGKTKLTITSHFQSIEDLEGMVKAGMESGTRESLEHIEEILMELQTTKIK